MYGQQSWFAVAMCILERNVPGADRLGMQPANAHCQIKPIARLSLASLQAARHENLLYRLLHGGASGIAAQGHRCQ